MGVLRCAVEIADVPNPHDDCLVLTALACDDAKPRGASVGYTSGVSLTFCLCELLIATSFIHQLFRFTLTAGPVSINLLSRQYFCARSVLCALLWKRCLPLSLEALAVHNTRCFGSGPPLP